MRNAILVAIGVLALAALFGFVRLAVDVRRLRARHAVGPSWSFPSRVYSDALSLDPGRALPDGYLLAELLARGYREVASAPGPGTFTRTPDRYEIFLRGSVLPSGRVEPPERVRLRFEGGRLASTERPDAPRPAGPAELEPVPIALLADEHRVLSTWVPLARIPLALQQAVVAAEDRRFRQHWGLDLRGNFRALVTNVQAGGVRQGASTITQQLARGLFLGRERTWSRKVAEAFIALGLEALLSKDQILEMYLNSVYWGQSESGGIAGAAEAARWYFDAPVESLDVAPCALLAGLIPAPNTFSPFRNPRLALARRNSVLADMAGIGFLDAATAARLRSEPLVTRRGSPPPDRFPSFVGYVRQYLADHLPAGAAEHWGLAVYTSLDPAWQEQAEQGLASGLDSLERWSGRGPEPLQGAFVAIDPATGFVRALVGGRAPAPGDFNRATQARRQTGSAIKPIVYAAALDPARGAPRFTPASTVPDLRRTFTVGDTIWRPRNDKEEYHPQATLAKALAKSLNVATANLVEAIGAGQVARYAERFGLGKLKPVASIGLGTNESTLLALTGAYAVFPARGVRHHPRPVRAALDGAGQNLLAAPPAASPVLARSCADLMTGLLEDVVIFGVSYPLRSVYGFLRPVAGKTGTTNDYNDAWFVGFVPDLAAGVWVGYDTPRTLQRPAAEVAIPVWAGIMKA
ncbi:MAG TPA: transglycosylase domain-containing protein, partial [Terriglobales bacterium]|nr:transglycosylase domain-containing protein [Terriglobales bacterium]